LSLVIEFRHDHQFHEGHGNLDVGPGSKGLKPGMTYFTTKGNVQIVHDNLAPEPEDMKAQVPGTPGQKIHQLQRQQHEHQADGTQN
jgi:hypothetical protein